MNVQTERLADHTARLTVEVDAERLEKAKRDAARKIAKQVNIPGFRKGKAPYHILVSYVGEAAIVEDALDVLGNEVYKDVLNQSDIEPYGPGALEDFKPEPQPTFQFVVPLQPTVDLGDYRAVRDDYEAPQVDDAEVDEALHNLQERHALIEESHQPVAAGNRVTVDLVGEFLDEGHHHDDDEADEEAAEEAEDVEEEHDDDDESKIFVDQNDMMFLLTEEREPAPGFSAGLEGAQVGETREFEITYPHDHEKYQQLAARHVKFTATIKKIETMTLPELTDDFAARVTEDEEKPLSLLELRMRVRDDLQKAAEEQANSAYADKVFEKMVEGATVSYPEALVADQLNHMLQRVDNDLRQRGMNLQDYLKISGRTLDDMRKDYRDSAIEDIKRILVMRELVKVENIEVTEERINEEVDRIVSQFGAQADIFRQMYEREDMRENLVNDLTNRVLMERVGEIGKGEAPDIDATETNEPSSESDEAPDKGE